MERAVDDLALGGVIERFGNLSGDADRLRRRCRAVLPDDDVKRVGRGEVLREIRAVAVDARGARRGDHRMLQFDRDQFFEFTEQLVHAFGREIEAEQLDGDEAVAILIIRTEYRAESTITDLMEHAKRTEGIGRRGAGSFRVQSRLLW